MKTRFGLSILFILLFNLPNGFGQDSLHVDIQKLLKIKPKTLNRIDRQLKYIKYDTIQMKELLRLSQKNNYPEAEIYAYNMLGKTNRINTNFSKAIFYHQKAYDKATEIDNLNMRIYSLNMLGVVYRRMDAVKSALEYHNKALQLAQNQTFKDKETLENIAISHNSIGNIYLLLERDDLAYLHFKKALKIEKQFDNKLGQAINYQNIGSILEKRGNLNQALAYYRKSLWYNDKINSKLGKIICNNSIGNVYLKQNQPEKALQIIQPNLLYAKELGDNYYLADVYINLGKVYLKLNKYQQAENFLKKGLQIAIDKKIPSQASEAYKQFSILEEKKGNYQAALAYHKKYTKEENKILNEKNRQLVTDVIIKQIKLENKEKIQELGQENQMVKKKLDKTKKSFYFTLLFSLLIFILGLIYYKQYQLNNQKKLMNLEQNLLRAQMNPHFIFNSLNSIKMFIIQNKPKDAVIYLSTFSKLVRSILQSTIDKETTLQDEINTIKMYVAIENTRFSNQIDFEIDVEDQLNLQQIKIPPLFTQPFIENALWHGLSPKEGDKKLTIRIYSKNDTHLVIEITDNGIGRKKAQEIKAGRTFKRASVGIKLSEERLKHFSKNYKYSHQLKFVDLYDENGEPAGTKVIIEIPYK